MLGVRACTLTPNPGTGVQPLGHNGNVSKRLFFIPALRAIDMSSYLFEIKQRYSYTYYEVDILTYWLQHVLCKIDAPDHTRLPHTYLNICNRSYYKLYWMTLNH